MIGWATRIVLAVTLLASGWQVFQQLVARQASRFLSGESAYQEAIRWDEDGADYHLELALHYQAQLDPELASRARTHFEQAAELNPYEPRARQELATIYEVSGERELAEQAHLSAVELRPTNGDLLWRVGNFYLRSGELAKALPQLERAMENDPGLVKTGADLLLNVGVAPAEVERLVPDDAASRRRLLDVLSARLGGPSPEPILITTIQVWRGLLEADVLTAEQGAFVINRLFRAGLGDVARREWAALNASVGQADSAYERQENLVWNGDFERPVIGGDLDWVLPSVESYIASQVQGEGVDGSSALRVEVAGSVPSGLKRLQQELVADGGPVYEFAARSRAEGFELGEVPRLAVFLSGARRPIATLEPPSPDGAWQNHRVQFELPDRTIPIVVRLVDSFNREVEGRVWIDSIELSPVG